jgi:hypothetical protein
MVCTTHQLLGESVGRGSKQYERHCKHTTHTFDIAVATTHLFLQQTECQRGELGARSYHSSYPKGHLLCTDTMNTASSLTQAADKES